MSEQPHGPAGGPPGRYPDSPYARGPYAGAPAGRTAMGYPPPAIPPPAGGPVRPPARLEPVPGTPFAVAYLSLPRTTSGTAISALVAGAGSLLVLLLVGCFGWLGAQNGVGALVGGAFAVLGALLGGAAIALGVVGQRQARRTGVRGRGLAIAGIGCGAAGIVLIGLTMVALLFT